MTATLVASGGEVKPLRLNFRSQPPLIGFFNYLFERLFQPGEGITPQELEELGYVAHEPSEAKRELRDEGPLVELMVTTEATGNDNDPKAELNSRELDAEQLALRIIALTRTASGTGAPNFKYNDIALLFRAMTHVQIYESAFRRANIPYQTVLGRGFYERPEITDLIQLLRFLDNKTDELALAAVLRSPLCGISDNALLALRCAPWLAEVDSGDPLRHFTQTRSLFQALRKHREIAFISDDEHKLLDLAANLIKQLIARRHHYSIGDLLRFAVEQSECMTVIAATFDGPQRLANVQRLFTLAARFERSGTHLIRDFVRYIEEFEAIGSRESEGQIDEAANAVRLMTIHQAKGLEFPVVIIPDLQRSAKPLDNWFLLDRHYGLTLKVPDGRGKLVAGCAFNNFDQRHALREQFESMRLLYVAATRAQDRLILSGTTTQFDNLSGKSDTWLKWIWLSLQLETRSHSGVIDLTGDVQLQLTFNLAEEAEPKIDTIEDSKEKALPEGESLSAVFPLLQAVVPERGRAVHRFSVTQLINYHRCPRQYYFDRVLHLPAADEMAVWNNAEAPEPPANLTATLKGAVIHRFCERYSVDQDSQEVLRRSFAEVVRSRQAELADRLVEIDSEAAIKDLLPLAENYLSSKVFARIEAARKLTSDKMPSLPAGETGLWSELSFRLRRPLGVLSGAIDKLLITTTPDGRGFEIEIIDFKTNRFQKPPDRLPAVATLGVESPRLARAVASNPGSQIAFDFSTPRAQTIPEPVSLDESLRVAAQDYQLQMQAYALAVRELIPNLNDERNKIGVTLHFLDPNLEYHLAGDLLAPGACEQAIDEALLQIISSSEPEHFPMNTAKHCRMCNFLGICAAGRDWVRTGSR
jgi:ATP-dependent helicase/nuclease subunit A